VRLPHIFTISTAPFSSSTTSSSYVPTLLSTTKTHHNPFLPVPEGVFAGKKSLFLSFLYLRDGNIDKSLGFDAHRHSITKREEAVMYAHTLCICMYAHTLCVRMQHTLCVCMYARTLCVCAYIHFAYAHTYTSRELYVGATLIFGRNQKMIEGVKRNKCSVHLFLFPPSMMQK
jgi:hypothetical protein